MAEALTIDESRVNEEFFAREWTDGLPVVAPTPARVAAVLEGAGLGAEDVLGSVEERGRELTAEKAAINAVMAGCAPEHFPVVAAALEAVLDPAFNANTVMTSTGGAALCLVLSGPLVGELGMQTRHNAMSPGNRANATIGRAVRLVAMNVFGARTGEMDGSSIGHPGKYTMLIAEAEPPPTWLPLRRELGYAHDDTTVTVFGAEGPRQVANHLNPDPEGILLTFAAAMRCPSTYCVGKGGQVVLVLGPEHVTALVEAGWTRAAVREFLADRSRIRPEELTEAGVLVEQGAQHDMSAGRDGRLPTVPGPDDIFLVTAGGAGAGWSAYIPIWAPKMHTQAVTRVVGVRG